MAPDRRADDPPADIMVARQPILDAEVRTAAYELLFRGPSTEGSAGALTASVIIDALAEIGLDRLVGDHPAYLNVTREFLLSFDPLPLPARRIVVELLEDQVVDDVLIERIARLPDEGFKLALDDYRIRAGDEPLWRHASIVKLDVLALSHEELVEHVEVLRPHIPVLLAEKVESREDFERCRDLGMTLFQGYFFARPHTMSSTGVPAERIASLDALARLLRTQGDFEALAEILSADVGLAYKLLRWANSGLVGRRMPVDSVHAALLRLGERSVRQWALMATLAAGTTRAPAELIRAAMLRARACELLCEGQPASIRASAYTVGLLSALDALFEAPLETLLERLPLDDSVVEAIVSHDGPLGRALARVLMLETSHPERSGVAGPGLLGALAAVDDLSRTLA